MTSWTSRRPRNRKRFSPSLLLLSIRYIIARFGRYFNQAGKMESKHWAEHLIFHRKRPYSAPEFVRADVHGRLHAEYEISALVRQHGDFVTSQSSRPSQG